MRLASTSRRRGTVTIIVVSFLLLLLLMGLTFAFYGLREAEETRVYMNSQNGGQTGVGPTSRGSSNQDQPPEPDVIVNKALSSAIYGEPDDLRGAFSVLRQQEIARSMFGWNPKYPSPYYGYAPPGLPSPPFPPPDPSRAAITPFNGIGRVRPGSDILPNCNPPMPANAALDNMINFAWVPGLFPGNVMIDIDNNYARNPTGVNPQPWQYFPKTTTNPAGTDRYWGKNANYTYPDHNNLFLAAVDAKTGKVLIPSYHRPLNMNGGGAPPNPPYQANGQLNVDPANDWTSAAGRLMVLRPRPIDHMYNGTTEFPYPTRNAIDGSYGDVELLEGKSMGRQLDAVWVDLDLPVGYWRGKAYKPLVAFLIVDLDGRINLNTAGNFYRDPTSAPLPAPYQPVHGSNQGVGPWEVNPSKVLLNYPQPPNPPGPFPNASEAANLTLNTMNPTVASGPASAHARYGLTWIGATPSWSPRIPYYPYNAPPPFPILNQPPPGAGAHFLSGVDFDGRRGVTAPMGSEQISANDTTNGHLTHFTFGPAFVGTPGNPNDPPRPDNSSRFGSGYYITDQVGNPVYDERTDHPLLYNPYMVRSRASLNLQLNPGNTLPNRTFGVEELRFLNAKYNYDKYTNSQLARLAPSTLGNAAFRSGELNARFATTVLSNDINLPGASPAIVGNYTYTPAALGQLLTQPKGTVQPVQPSTIAPIGVAFDDSFRSNLVSVLGSVDIDRKLTDYRANINRPLGPNNVGNVVRAISDRQQLAADIFKRLRRVTVDPAGTTPPQAGNGTDRWLAQLAVNIVDFIDNDDCITPFCWTSATGSGTDDLSNDDVTKLAAFSNTVKQQWVFGFERPRVNVNEAFVRIENDPNDNFPVDPNDGKKKASQPADMKIWLELHNPITPASNAEQFSGSEGYPDPAATDDGSHGGYRATMTDAFQAGEKSTYRALMYKVKPNGAPANDPMGMRPRPGDDNVAGLPTSANTTPLTADSMSNKQLVLYFSKNSDQNGNTVDDPSMAGAKNIIPPNVQAQYKDASFYLAGPAADQQNGAGKAQIPGAQAQVTSKALQTKVILDPNNPVDFKNQQIQWSPGVVLQRLCCPALPPDYQINGIAINPYVTVDYWESNQVAVNNRLKYDGDGNPGDPMNPGQEPDWMSSYAWGRRQPYDGVVLYGQQQSSYYKQLPGGAPANGTPNHSLGRHNGTDKNNWPNPGDQTLQLPFIPLAHYDRIVLSPIELFNVTALKPFEVTREFGESPTVLQPGQADYYLDPATRRLKYTVDWLDHGATPTQPGQQASYLYRALDLLRPSSFTMGIGTGGRIPGKINANTLFTTQLGTTYEVFDAAFDQNSANRFTQADVQSAWGNLTTTDPNFPRTPQMGGGQITLNDKPLYGLAAPMIDPVTGAPADRYRTLVRPDMLWSQSDPTKSKENYAVGGHAGALEKYEMLSKVYNQFTTRSNTFAVYMAIGYFEVRNPGPWTIDNRPVLGKELGTDDGTVTRHKYFSVIDRTNLSIEANNQVAIGQPLPAIKQGQPPVYFSYQPATPLPSAPAFAVAGTEDPQPNGQPSQIKIPATGMDATNRVMGYYDGSLWSIQPGQSQLMIDIGDRQEAATITAATFDALTSSAVLTISPLTIQHSRGASIRLTNPDWTQPPSTPGHPGPQPGFNYKSQRYAPVVRYVEQLK
jgi:hypothetical protein